MRIFVGIPDPAKTVAELGLGPKEAKRAIARAARRVALTGPESFLGRIRGPMKAELKLKPAALRKRIKTRAGQSSASIWIGLNDVSSASLTGRAVWRRGGPDPRQAGFTFAGRPRRFVAPLGGHQVVAHRVSDALRDMIATVRVPVAEKARPIVEREGRRAGAQFGPALLREADRILSNPRRKPG